MRFDAVILFVRERRCAFGWLDGWFTAAGFEALPYQLKSSKLQCCERDQESQGADPGSQEAGVDPDTLRSFATLPLYYFPDKQN